MPGKTDCGSVAVIKGISTEVPKLKFSSNRGLRLPNGCKPMIMHHKSSLASRGQVAFITNTPGSGRLTLDSIRNFVKQESMEFANLDHTVAVAMNGVGRKLASRLDRKPNEALAYFCLATTGVDGERQDKEVFYPLVIHPASGHEVAEEPVISFLSESYLRNFGIHPRWVVPVLRA